MVLRLLTLACLLQMCYGLGQPCGDCVNYAPPIQNQFCQAHFAIKVKVLSVKKTKRLKKYEVQITETFKWPTEDTMVNTKVLLTGKGIFKCGCEMDTNTEYVVTGLIEGGALTLDACHSAVIKVGEMTDIQWKNFRVDYNIACLDCSVTLDFEESESESICHVSRDDLICVEKDSVCEKTNMRCAWRDDDNGNDEDCVSQYASAFAIGRNAAALYI